MYGQEIGERSRSRGLRRPLENPWENGRALHRFPSLMKREEYRHRYFSPRSLGNDAPSVTTCDRGEKPTPPSCCSRCGANVTLQALTNQARCRGPKAFACACGCPLTEDWGGGGTPPGFWFLLSAQKEPVAPAGRQGRNCPDAARHRGSNRKMHQRTYSVATTGRHGEANTTR